MEFITTFTNLSQACTVISSSIERMTGRYGLKTSSFRSSLTERPTIFCQIGMHTGRRHELGLMRFGQIFTERQPSR